MGQVQCFQQRCVFQMQHPVRYFLFRKNTQNAINKPYFLCNGSTTQFMPFFQIKRYAILKNKIICRVFHLKYAGLLQKFLRCVFVSSRF